MPNVECVAVFRDICNTLVHATGEHPIEGNVEDTVRGVTTMHNYGIRVIPCVNGINPRTMNDLRGNIDKMNNIGGDIVYAVLVIPAPSKAKQVKYIVDAILTQNNYISFSSSLARLTINVKEIQGSPDMGRFVCERIGDFDRGLETLKKIRVDMQAPAAEQQMQKEADVTALQAMKPTLDPETRDTFKMILYSDPALNAILADLKERGEVMQATINQLMTRFPSKISYVKRMDELKNSLGQQRFDNFVSDTTIVDQGPPIVTQGQIYGANFHDENSVAAEVARLGQEELKSFMQGNPNIARNIVAMGESSLLQGAITPQEYLRTSADMPLELGSNYTLDPRKRQRVVQRRERIAYSN